MVTDTDTEPGKVVIRDAESILGLTLDVHLTPQQTHTIADNLEREGKHTHAVDELRAAAAEAQRKG